MAGSYEHILDGWSLIENMGDAHEAVEQLLYLVESQIGADMATKILDRDFYPMVRGEKEKDKYFRKVKYLMEN